mmetsp:Transcript_13699/g.33734  ORF Transcript_13699/g.33734 Transcript_13699/m.33734 type:complete len:246 (-) Transcript_13699:176-913(-)
MSILQLPLAHALALHLLHALLHVALHGQLVVAAPHLPPVAVGRVQHLPVHHLLALQLSLTSLGRLPGCCLLRHLPPQLLGIQLGRRARGRAHLLAAPHRVRGVARQPRHLQGRGGRLPRQLPRQLLLPRRVLVHRRLGVHAPVQQVDVLPQLQVLRLLAQRLLVEPECFRQLACILQVPCLVKQIANLWPGNTRPSSLAHVALHKNGIALDPLCFPCFQPSSALILCENIFRKRMLNSLMLPWHC